MKVVFKNNSDKNVLDLMRSAGYHPHNGDSFVREIGSLKYPRFHIYLKEAGDNLVFNLHLDQKRPVYKGTRAHSGEYEGEIVEKELQRIKNVFNA